MKHPILKFTSPQASHLSSLIFLGVIFYSAFINKSYTKKNPIKGTSLRVNELDLLSDHFENYMKEMDDYDSTKNINKMFGILENVVEIIDEFSYDLSYSPKSFEVKKQKLKSELKALDEKYQADQDPMNEIYVPQIAKIQVGLDRLFTELREYMQSHFENFNSGE